MTSTRSPKIAALKSMIERAESIVALSGAGISTESGIPDFRSQGGLWSRMKPITYQEFITSEDARLEDWRRRFSMNEDFRAAEPNAGHRALAALAGEGRLSCLVTQNIDGLHQRAGHPPEGIIEIHGNSTHGRCLDCRETMSLDAVRTQIVESGAAPRCHCGGLVKAAVISFGQTVPPDLLHRAAMAARKADLFLVIGSSLVVQPVASLPLVAHEAGARLAIVNRDSTPIDSVADLLLPESIGTVFAQICP